MHTLFDQTNIGSIKLKNRIIRAATDVNLADEYGHIPEDFLDLNADLAKGGVGMVILGFTGVAPLDYRKTGLLKLSNDDVIEEYKKLADIMHGHGCPVIPQLGMGVYLKDKSTGTLATPDSKDEDIICIDPADMTHEDINTIKALFTEAAKRAKKAGFDGVQLHCAHGFLLDAFTNIHINKRTDDYGGSLENRYRIITEIIDAIKKEIPEMPVLAKVNAGELKVNSKADPDCVKGCALLEKHGIDAIEISSNGVIPANIMAARNEGYFLPLAKDIRENVSCPLILTGGFRTVGRMEDYLNDEGIDYFSLSRPLIKEPELVARWAGEDFKPSACMSCLRCFKTYGHQCAVQEPRYVKEMDGRFYRSK